MGALGSGGAKYPEWDVTRGRYRPEWCTVAEANIRTDASTTMVVPDGLTEALYRSLARLAMGPARCRRQPQGDDVDVDAAIETHIDALAGLPTDGDVYVENRRQRRDLGVLVLLDVSGSAGEPGAAGWSVHEHQRLAAAALTTALRHLGDRVGLYAFNSRGRQAVQYFRVMDFDEHLDAKAIKRLAALQPTAYTRMGAAIRHATTLLTGRSGTPRRLLVVLSDGFAYDHGYEGHYGESDARRALTEARRQGVGCVCLSVGASTDPDALRRGLRLCRACVGVESRRSAGIDCTAFSQRHSFRRRPAPRSSSGRSDRENASESKWGCCDTQQRPFYISVGDEEQVFKAACRQRLAVVLKGPTGCGKTRFVEAMAHDLDRPLITVSCHDDLTAADLVGRFLLEGGETRWVDGPLTRAVREGAICYLDEIVEARQDTTVVLHPLADHRRQLPIDRLGQVVDASPEFSLVVSYNPGYQSVLEGSQGLDPSAHGGHRTRLSACDC